MATVEVTNLPPGATFDELRAVMGATSATFSLQQGQTSALVLLDSPSAAEDAVELLNGSEWAGQALVVRRVDVGAWVAAHCSQYMPGSRSATSSRAVAAPAAAPPAAHQGAAATPAPQAATAATDAVLRAPGFELPEWNWDQAAGATSAEASLQPQGWPQQQQVQQAGHEQPYHAALPGDSWADEYWAGASSAPAGSEEEEEWQPVSTRYVRNRSGHSGGAGGALPAGSVEISNTRIMIRNLSPDTTEQAVTAAFRRFGPILQVIKAPNRRFAHLMFASPDSAAAALHAMHEQLVPELNDQGLILVQPSLVCSDPATTAAVRDAPREAAEAAAAATAGASGVHARTAALAGFGSSKGAGHKGISDTPTPAVWVGNMGAGATTESVRAVFSRYGPLVQWQVQDAKLPPGQVKPGSLRYAIVRWKRVEHAQAAMQALHKQVEPQLGPYALKLRYRLG